MLTPLIEQVSLLIQPLTGQFQVLFEVQSASGIPDMVLIAFDDQEIARRKRLSLPPVVDASDVAVMTALSELACRSRSEDTATSAELSAETGVTAGYLSSVVLKRLADQGHVRRVKRGCWTATHSFKSLASHVIAIETKISDWRRGFWQAHRQAADYTWLVMDAAHGAGCSEKIDRFLSCKVGLATLSASSGYLEVKAPAKIRQPHSAHRNLLVERAAALYLAGSVSGPLSPVFGRQLSATTGVDPRLLGAGAR